MLTPLGGLGTNPLGGGNALLGGRPPGIGGGVPGMGGLGMGGPMDLAGISPDALDDPNGGDINALMQAMQMDPKQMRIMQLQQEIQQTQGALQQAQAIGNQPAVEQLGQRLQQLQGELQQLMGGDGQQQPGAGAPGGGAPGGGEAGGAPAGGAPGGGGCPGGNCGGGAPAGGAPGGGAPGGGAPAGGGPIGGGPAAVGNNGGAATGPGTAAAMPNPELKGNDQQMAQAIEEQLKGTPLEGKGLGAHFVQAGKQNNVDPLALVAISKHETNHGKLGVGVTKHMGVGAYDANPNGKTRFDGAQQQIYSGAKTFANLRRKGGSNADAPMSQQLSAVNRAGWATDRNWHSKVGSSYNKVVAKANTSAGGSTQLASNKSTSTPAPSKPSTSSTSSTSTTKKA